jgi:hypothetical protein
MSALLTRRRASPPAREKPRGPAEQPPLFGAAAAPIAAPAPTAAPSTTEPLRAPAAAPEASITATVPRQEPTLDDLVAGAWEGLLTGAPAECLACGSSMAPRHSAGAGVVGGRCGGCGSTLA